LDIIFAWTYAINLELSRISYPAQLQRDFQSMSALKNSKSDGSAPSLVMYYCPLHRSLCIIDYINLPVNSMDIKEELSFRHLQPILPLLGSRE